MFPHRFNPVIQLPCVVKTLHSYLNIPHMNLILVNLLVGQVVKEHFHILLNLSDFFFCEVCSDERFSLINVTWNVHIRRLIHKNVPKEWKEGFEVAAISCLLLLIYKNHQLEKKPLCVWYLNSRWIQMKTLWLKQVFLSSWRKSDCHFVSTSKKIHE